MRRKKKFDRKRLEEEAFEAAAAIHRVQPAAWATIPSQHTYSAPAIDPSPEMAELDGSEHCHASEAQPSELDAMSVNASDVDMSIAPIELPTDSQIEIPWSMWSEEERGARLRQALTSHPPLRDPTILPEGLVELPG
jgi:hypothetical protein